MTTRYPLLPSLRLATGITIGALFSYRVISAVYRLYFHPLAKYPGPKLWAISRIPWAWHLIRGDLWQVLGRFHEKYGTTVRIAPDELTTISPTAWTDIYVTKPLLPKDPHSQTPPLNGAHSLFTAPDNTHKRIRTTLVNGFSDKALREQAPIIEAHANNLVSRLHREAARAAPGGSIDIQKLFGYATFDIVTDLSFGESVRGLEDDNEHAEITAFFFHAKFGTIRNCLSRFSPLDILLGLFLLSISRKARERNWRLTTEKIDRRLSKGDMTGVRSDFMTPVIGRIDESGTKGITKKEVVTNGLAFVIADCQLTTVALATSTYLLLRDRPKWEQLTKEIRGRFSSHEEITVHSSQGLPYLEAVINETLRLHHPTPISLPRSVPPEGRVIDGEHIPGNTVIGINLQNIQNDPSLWEEPRVFHPERFLPATDERYDGRFDKDVRAAYVPFSTGPRNCLGARVFLAQARVILAKLVWSFDLKMGSVGDDWLDQKAYLVFEPKPLPVKILPRQDTVA
ncbi:cytochrome P450 monooxygenase-like protein [Stachybotrys elegans]|uniref:Cytochrome P450 monooxygenase-like protein n=1 Tax=Stachybotrys elegans TaxID=80388 RepID=A0A8K0SXC2_9HYPO|nr:cytochrome P450 monooxygenase-like protein [Stachybotrys elegans]